MSRKVLAVDGKPLVLGGKVLLAEGDDLYRLQEVTITPTKAQQVKTPDADYYGFSKVTVAAIPAKYKDTSGVTAEAADVLTGKTIVGADGTTIEGSMANNGAITKTIDGLTETSASVPAGYTSGGTVSLTDAIETALAAI